MDQVVFDVLLTKVAAQIDLKFCFSRFTHLQKTPDNCGNIWQAIDGRNKDDSLAQINGDSNRHLGAAASRPTGRAAFQPTSCYS
jgi:hypothetical protein